MKRTGHLIFAALFTIGLAGLAYAAGTGGPGGGGASGLGGVGPGMDAPPPPGTTPGTPPGSDIGRTPKPGTAPSEIETTPGSTRRPGESTLELGRQPVPPGSSPPPDSGLTPPVPTGKGQGTGSGLGSPTPGLGSSAPWNPAGSQGASPGTGATK